MKLTRPVREPVIEKIYRTRLVVGRSGRTHELRGAIDQEEGEFLFSIIRSDPTILRTLEVGCGQGLSSLHICSALRGREGASHIIIDPYQHTPRPGAVPWDGAGVIALEEAGIDFFHLIEIKSEFALPRLLEQYENQLDLIFIDGWHTFDHTLLDCFYATRLLRVGGALIIDDLKMPSVRNVVGFLKNYPCYEELDSGGGGRQGPRHSAARQMRKMGGDCCKTTVGFLASQEIRYQKVLQKRRDTDDCIEKD